MSSCTLTHFPFDWIETKLTSLRILHLGHNRLSIPNNLDNFSSLSLNNNNNRNSNNNNGSLIKLDLQYNKIDYLPPNVIQQIEKIAGMEVIMDGNPILSNLSFRNSVHQFTVNEAGPNIENIFEPSSRFQIAVSDMKGKRKEMVCNLLSFKLKILNRKTLLQFKETLVVTQNKIL